MPQRRELRVQMSMDVKLWGVDSSGRPLMQPARTLDATNLGARITGVNFAKVGDVVNVQLGVRKARFRVVWVGRDHTAKAGQIGVECLEPDKVLFFPERSGRLESGFDREDRSARRESSVRRQHPRYRCTGGVELRREKGQPIWANLSDVSLSGC